MEWLGKGLVLLIAGIIVWGLWRASRPPRLFIVRIAGGAPHLASGNVTAAFLQRVREIVTEHGIPSGQVCGVRVWGNQIRLEFTGQFPPEARQQLRNWWVQSGWPAGPRRK